MAPVVRSRSGSDLYAASEADWKDSMRHTEIYLQPVCMHLCMSTLGESISITTTLSKSEY